MATPLTAGELLAIAAILENHPAPGAPRLMQRVLGQLPPPKEGET